jgi:hypothetical protein
MPKGPSPKDVKKSSSGKVDTTIIVALIALIGTLGTALFNSPVILEWIRNKPAFTASPAQVQPPSSSASPASVVSVPSPAGGDADCLTQHFADIDSARQMSIEAGATNQDYTILSQDLSGNNIIGPIGIRLTQNGKMIAALSFLFISDNRLFKITSLVDSNCQAVAEYSNVDRGGDRNTIQDSDTLKIVLAEGSFSLRFIFYGANNFRFNFLQL